MVTNDKTKAVSAAQHSPFDFTQAVRRYFLPDIEASFRNDLIKIAVILQCASALFFVSLNFLFFGEGAIIPLYGIGWYFLHTLLEIILQIFIQTPIVMAFHNKIFHNKGVQRFSLRFGVDEWRMTRTVLAVISMISVPQVVLCILMFLYFQFAGLMGDIIFSALFVFLVALSLVSMVYGLVALSPSVAWRSYMPNGNVFGGWSISKHRRKEIFLAYLAVLVLGMVLAICLVVPLVMLPTFGNELFSLFIGALVGLMVSIFSVFYYLSLSGIGVYTLEWWLRDQEIAMQNRNET